MPITRVVTPATVLPVPLELAKQYLRVDAGNEQDAIVAILLAGAVDVVEQYTSRALTPRTLETTFQLGEEYRLPWLPAGEPATVTGAITELTDLTRGYSEDYRKGIIVSRDYPLGSYALGYASAPTYAVTYPAGYAYTPAVLDVDGVTVVTPAASACPAVLQTAVLKVLSELYENREVTVDGRVTPVSVGVRELLGPWRTQPLLV